MVGASTREGHTSQNRLRKVVPVSWPRTALFRMVRYVTTRQTTDEECNLEKKLKMVLWSVLTLSVIFKVFKFTFVQGTLKIVVDFLATRKKH